MYSNSQPLDIDRIALLATTRPDVIDRYLRFKVRQIIRQAKPDSQMTLERLQFRMDGIRRRAATPMSACIQISRFMHEHLWELNDLLKNGYQDARHELPEQITEPAEQDLSNTDTQADKTAKVLPFRRNKPS